MWISRKRWNSLEKRVADLETNVQSLPLVVEHSVDPDMEKSKQADFSETTKRLLETTIKRGKNQYKMPTYSKP